MKKVLFSILAAAAVFASCTKFVYDEPVKFIEAETPEVTAKAVSDSAIFVTVVPKQSTSFYSYIVAKGRAAKLDSVSLLKNGYKANALKIGEETYCGVIDFAKQATVSLNIKGLAPNTYYTVYAVANNAQGKVSSVAAATCLTTDGIAPVLKGFDCEEEDSVLAFAIKFDDPVALGGGTVTAHYYALYGGTEKKTAGETSYYALKEQGNYEVPADSLFAKDNYIYVFLPREQYIPGAYVSLSYTEGLAMNALGEKCAAFEGYEDMIYDSEEGGYVSYGIYGQYKNVPFKLSLNPEGDAEDEDDSMAEADDDEEEEEELEPEIFSDWTELVMKSYAQTQYPLAGRKITTAAISVVDGNGRTVSYTGQQLTIVDKANGIVGVALDEDPGFGTYVSYSIAAKSVLDIYGNTNAEFSVEKGYFCSYGYTVADIVGTYSVSAYNAYTGAAVSTSFAIAESDDATKGNIIITKYLNIPTTLYATFDLDNGYFTVKAGVGLYQDTKNGYIYATDFYNGDYAVFNVPAAGSITCSDYYVGAYVYGTDGSKKGYYLLSYDFVATRTE